MPIRGGDCELLQRRKILRKVSIVDFHGFAWHEACVMDSAAVLRLLLLLSEYLAYKWATYVIAASKWLSKALSGYFGTREVFVIENAITPIFERVVSRLKQYDTKLLRRYIYYKLRLDHNHVTSTLLVAPLPPVFESNVLAYKVLLDLARKLPSNVLIIVTGLRHKVTKTQSPVICAGYLKYPEYVALLLSADAVILTYPSSAICGGVRNKVLEAGYCMKPIISTRVGMLHLPVRPNLHYIPLETLQRESMVSVRVPGKYRCITIKLHELILHRYSFAIFRESVLRIFLKILKSFLLAK